MKKIKGFTLIEIIIVLALITISSGFAIQLLKGEMARSQSVLVAQQLKEVANATETYIGKFNQEIIALRSVPGARACNAATHICTITMNTLAAEKMLPKGYSNATRNYFGDQYIIKLYVNPANKVEGVVMTAKSSISRKKTLQEAGIAVKEVGINGGVVQIAKTLSGLSGRWEETSTIYGALFNEVAQVGMRVGYKANADSPFLYRTASLGMSGDLDVGGNSINHGVVIKGATLKTDYGVFEAATATKMAADGGLSVDTLNSTSRMDVSGSTTANALGVDGDSLFKGNVTVAGNVTATGGMTAKTFTPTNVESNFQSCAGVAEGTIAKEASGKTVNCKNGLWQLITCIPGTQVFTDPIETNFIMPAGCSMLNVRGSGGGGGAGSGGNSMYSASGSTGAKAWFENVGGYEANIKGIYTNYGAGGGGGGGSSGQYKVQSFVGIVSGSSMYVKVGAGGSFGGVASGIGVPGNSGTNGGETFVQYNGNTIFSALGGLGGSGGGKGSITASIEVPNDCSYCEDYGSYGRTQCRKNCPATKIVDGPSPYGVGGAGGDGGASAGTGSIAGGAGGAGGVTPGPWGHSGCSVCLTWYYDGPYDGAAGGRSGTGGDNGSGYGIGGTNGPGTNGFIELSWE